MKNNTKENKSAALPVILDQLSQIQNQNLSSVTVVGESLGRISHGVPRLVACIEGCRTYRLIRGGCDTTLETKPGEVYFISPNGFFEPTTDDLRRSAILSVVYFPRYVRGLVLHCPKDGSRSAEDRFLHVPRKQDGFEQNLLRTFTEARFSSGEDQAILMPLMQSLLAFTVGQFAKNPVMPVMKKDYLWQAMNSYLLDKFDAPVSRLEMARAFKITPNYVSNLFKRHTGKTFSEACATRRLERAAAMLMNTHLSIKEIGRECGYSYPSYFIRQFKQEYGITPKIFRVKRRN